MLRRKDGHVLRRLLEFEGEGQTKKVTKPATDMSINGRVEMHEGWFLQGMDYNFCSFSFCPDHCTVCEMYMQNKWFWNAKTSHN